MTETSRQKLKYLEKRAFKMKLKAFFIIFKGLSIKQIKRIFLEGESLISSFDSAWWRYPQNWLEKEPKLVSHALMVIEIGVVHFSENV